MRLLAVLSLLLLTGLSLSVRAEDQPVTGNKVHKKEQQLENEVKTERDRPQKKERAKAAAGRVEDGVRDFGRGLQGVMKEAGIGDGPASPAPKKAEAKPDSKPAPARPATDPGAPAKPTASDTPAKSASAPAPKKAAKPRPAVPLAPATPAAPAK